MRVALYIRVSTDEQAASGYSIPDQIRELTRHAEQMGYEVVAPPIVDDGYSGASPDRPGLSRVIELAESGQINLAIATKRDRWFRSRMYRLMLDEDMEEYGCRLVALNDTNNQIGDGVQDEFAEWERKEIAKRTRAGRFEKARSGRVIPAVPPYGLRRVGEGRDAYYEPNPTTMPVVRRVFEMVAGGESLRSVKRTFEKEGILSPGGKPCWSPYMVRRVVLQDAYRIHTREELVGLREEGLLKESVISKLGPDRDYGISWYGREEVHKTRHGKKNVPRPRDQWVACPVPLSGFGVPTELVDKARAAIQNNERPSRADGILWQLSGVVARCACGRTMLSKRVTARGKVYHYYCCGSYWRPSGERCEHAGTHPAKGLEECIENLVLSLIRDPEVLREKVATQAEAERQRLGRASYEIARLRSHLEKISKTRRGYLKQQAEGIIETTDELKVLLGPLDAERDAVEREIETLGNNQDQEGRLRELDALPDLVNEYLRDLAYLVEGSGIIPREYETIPEERTENNPLGVYTLTPDRVRTLTEEEQAAKGLEARNARSAKFRDLYETLDLGLVVHKDGTLEVSWSLGASVPVLPGVVPAQQTEIGKRLGLPQRKISRIVASATKSLKEKLTQRQ